MLLDRLSDVAAPVAEQVGPSACCRVGGLCTLWGPLLLAMQAACSMGFGGC